MQTELSPVNKVNTHEYALSTYTIDKGLKNTGEMITIRLVRGSKVEEENVLPKQDGLITEQLLEVALNYLSSVNVGDMRTKETSMAITKIEEALMWIEARRTNREKRGVLSTYKK